VRYRWIALAAAALLLEACQPVRPDTAGLSYRCEDGSVVQASYPDAGHARLILRAKPHRLAIARSGSGARYTGPGWQWWTRGMRQASLAPLLPGEKIASAPGMACEAP
jgi:membrane-bound inhibitor of C-type lysozyme